MRIIIDLQGAQGSNRMCGVGRYSLSLVRAMLHNCNKHEIIVTLNELLPDGMKQIYAALDGLLSPKKIHIWQAPGPTNQLTAGNEQRCKTAEFLREAFLVSLNPDVILVSSFFEGFNDEAVISINRLGHKIPISVVAYDLMPLFYSEKNLKNLNYMKWYKTKISQLGQVDLLFAISELPEQKGIRYLDFPPERIINISAVVGAKIQTEKVLWDKNAKLVLSKLETLQVKQAPKAFSEKWMKLPRLAYISPFPLPPEQSDISDYDKRLLLELGDHYDIDVVVDDREIFSDWIKANYRMKTVCWFKENANSYDRVLYHFCNSVSHQYMFELLELFPGIVVLHDFFLSELFSRTESRDVWIRELYYSHGYRAVQQLCVAESIRDIMVKYPCNYSVFQNALGIITPSRCWRKLARFWYGPEIGGKFIEIPLLSVQAPNNDECEIKSVAQELAQISHATKKHAYQYVMEIERFYRSSVAVLPRLIKNISQLKSPLLDKKDLKKLAVAINQSIPAVPSHRQLFVDISGLVCCDYKTGIQRVVRALLQELLLNPPLGYVVEPVYMVHHIGYCYARQFTFGFLNCPKNMLDDGVISFGTGDVFLGLDWAPDIVIQAHDFYQQLRRHGVKVTFLVYDLLPVLMPRYFPEMADEIFRQWLSVVVKNDGAVCISRAVKNELNSWIQKNSIETSGLFKSSWFHLGSDIKNSLPSKGLPNDADSILANLCRRISFVVVATIEPRKGHNQILAAFELLWRKGLDVNLVFVGKKGWKVETLIKKFYKHAERNNRFLWLNDVSDEYLENIYNASNCLIAASEGEGFGLPLIEAARHGIPIIARDMPVFREVLGEHAFYFKGTQVTDLSNAVIEWLALCKKNQHPKSDAVPHLSWEQSAVELLEAAGINHIHEENICKR